MDLRNPTTLGAFVAVTVAIFVFFCYVLVNNFRQAKRTHQWINLHRPLHPSAIDLRLDAALRDAEEGFNACDACQFENLKRNIFCTLCGAPVIDTTKDKSKHKKRKDMVLVREHLASTSANGRRHARALKRKEWTRQINADGALYWSHDDTIGLRTRGVVLEFAGDPLNVEAPPSARDQLDPQPENEPVVNEHVAITIDHEADHTESGRSAVETASVETSETSAQDPDTDSQSKSRIEYRTIAETHDLLTTEIVTHPMVLVQSADADPSRPAIVLSAVSQFQDEPKILVINSQLNFPSKMAEFVARSSTALMLSNQAFFKIKVRRERLLDDSLVALAAKPAQCARCPIRMTFVGEQGIDAGGVYREWLVLVNEQIVAPEAGIFRCVDSRDRSFYLNPTSQHDIGEHHLAHIFATGRLLGRMLLEGNVTGFHLALPLLKIMVGQPVTFSDLEFFDPDAYKNLSWLLENDGVDALGLDFTVTKQTANGQTIVVELIPNGANIDVTDANKHEYVDLKFKYLLFGSVESQLFAFLKGLYEVMPPELLMLFDAEELDFVLSGSDEIDVDDWERNSKYTENLIEHPVRGWFWDLVREMPNEYRRRLLLFSTGSSRVPLAGFASLTSYDGRLCPFMLKGVDMAEGGEYIHSHACFNRLDLPRYAKKRDLKAVLYGILDTDLYGFTTA